MSASETFRNVMSGLQSIVVITGIAVGGYWTAQTFVFENPRFSETGGETLGNTPKNSAVGLSTRRLGGDTLEFTATIANLSKTLDLVVHPHTLSLKIVSLENRKSFVVPYQNLAAEDDPQYVTAGQKLAIRFAHPFVEKGLHLAEFDPCQNVSNGRCSSQIYFVIE